ncbi:MAG: DNA polymerase III subunit alpha [Alphaproteobacteria bacterium]|nr:DNA polymerase III subunit alpha [Alphaproteobacteria bacterium]
MMPRFIHLHTHSSYSLAEGAIKMGQLIALAKQNDMPALALTDTGNLFGSLEFSMACMKEGIQPIIGTVLAFLPKQSDPHRAAHGIPATEKLVLLAKDETGYRNLLRLVSKSFLEPAHPHVVSLHYEELKEMQEGLIALTGGGDGGVCRRLADKKPESAAGLISELHALFGDRLYVEITRHGLPHEAEEERFLLDQAFTRGIPLVAANDVYFAKPEMHEAHDALLCIADGRYVLEENRRRVTPEHYFKSPEQMAALFADLPEAVRNTEAIARRCAVMSPARKPMLPNFPVPDGGSEEDEFCKAARAGLEARLEKSVFRPDMGDVEKEELAKAYHERLEFEIATIIKMKFPGYFLIVSDFITWSKEQGIPVGPGRGSGAGSLVAWSMRITDLDPLRFGLLFERFLNPERVSMPDFDIDFCQDRRDEVIRYVQKKYGFNRVAQIITFGKLQARAVLRDVGRVLQMPYGQVDKICKLVPNNPANPVDLQQAMAIEPMLRDAVKSDPQVERLMGIGMQLEGLYRHASTHAAGVVIAGRDLVELVPLYRDPRSDMLVVQYSMKYAEEAGLVKFDFLGLKTLTVIATCEKLVNARGTKLEVAALPLDDAKTYQLLGRGDGSGVFQLESAGMRDVLKKLKPDSFEDIIALVSLYRPGPMDNIPTYIARKHGLEKPEYPHPLLESILKETYGVIIYQEQVMQIAQVLSNYSLGGADLLRRAMGKKIKAEMDAQRDIFVKGAVENGVDKEKANFIFDLVDKFAGYGFNKSHAAAYALIAYQTAYLKANHPVEFYAATMTYDQHNTDKLASVIQEVQKSGIKLLPPDINTSFAQFMPEGDAIRYSLGALKNVGVEAMNQVVAERERGGPFASVIDFMQRADSKILNKRQMEQLVASGAFDSLHANRGELYENLERLIRYAGNYAEQRESQQNSLFGGATQALPPPPLEKKPAWSGQDKLQKEFEAVGFYLSSHPLEAYREELSRLGCALSVTLGEVLDESARKVTLAGILLNLKIKASNRGRFAFAQLSDMTGVFEISIFDEMLLDKTRAMLGEGQLLCIQADGRRDGEQMRLIATDISRLDDALAKKTQPATVQFRLASRDVLPQFKAALEKLSPGKCSIMLVLPTGAAEDTMIALPGRYALGPVAASEISNLLGNGAH